MKEDVKKNVKSKKDVLDFLKKLKMDSVNKHEQFEFQNYIISVVKISLIQSSNIGEYVVYLLCSEKLTENIYNNLLLEKFDNNIDAESYYMELKSKIYILNDQDIGDFIMSIQ